MNSCKGRPGISIKPIITNRQTIDKVKVVEIQFVDILINVRFQSIIKVYYCKIGLYAT